MFGVGVFAARLGEVFDLDPLFAGKTLDGLGGRGKGWSLDELFAVGFALGQADNAQGETAGGAVGLGVGELRAEVVKGRRDHPVGDFFGADFEEEVHSASCKKELAADERR